MPTPMDRDFPAADEHSVSQDAELRLDDHRLDIEARPHKRLRGIPARKPLSEGFFFNDTASTEIYTITPGTPPIPASTLRRSWESPERLVLRGSPSRITTPWAESRSQRPRQTPTSSSSRRLRSRRDPAMSSGTEFAKSSLGTSRYPRPRNESSHWAASQSRPTRSGSGPGSAPSRLRRPRFRHTRHATAGRYGGGTPPPPRWAPGGSSARREAAIAPFSPRARKARPGAAPRPCAPATCLS